jgi:APA family basic amino acid/polyamine antiporter
MIGTALSCIVIFLLMNAALFHVLRMDHLAGSQIPAADAAMLVFGRFGKQVILLISPVAVISTINAGLLYTPRILYAMARDRLLPRDVTFVNKGGTPALALFLCTLASIILVVTGTFETLIAMGSILFVAVYLSGFASLLVLRRSEPELPRPYKVWWYPWSMLAVSFASAAFLLGSVLGDLRHSLFTAILIFLSYAASRLVVREEAHSNV